MYVIWAIFRRKLSNFVAEFEYITEKYDEKGFIRWSRPADGDAFTECAESHKVQKHFESFIGEILRRIPPKDRKTLTTVVVDSWERGKQNYTDSIYIKFRQRFGYELDYTNPACQNDLNHLISDLVASEYMGGLTEKAHEYGLRTWCEPYAQRQIYAGTSHCNNEAQLD